MSRRKKHTSQPHNAAPIAPSHGPKKTGFPLRTLGVFAGLVVIISAGAWMFFNPKSKVPDTAALPKAWEFRPPSSGLESAAAQAESGTSASSTLTPVHQGGSLVEAAAEAFAKGNIAMAIQLYEQALAAKPTDEDLHYNLGVAYAAQGNLEKAEYHYREALKLLADYPEVHNNLGNLLSKQGKLAEAEEHFQEALKLMPEYATAHNNLGILRQRQGKISEALTCFEKAAKYDTNYWQARFNLANTCLVQGNIQQAIANFKEVLRINPACEPAQKSLAKALGQTPPYVR